MIKFFRKLRLDALSRKRFPKYIAYAIGEIILVVIGILIALQVNEWNNQQNRQKAEQVILTQIEGDLEQSQIELGDMKDYHLDRAKTCAKILREFWKTEGTDDAIALDLRSARSTINYGPILGNIKSLINSGNIDLVSNRELKDNMVSYVEYVESQLRDLTRAEESYFRKGVEILDEIMPNNVQDIDYYIKEIKERDPQKRPRWYVDDISPTPTQIEDIVKVPFKANVNELFKSKQFYIGYKKIWTHQFNSYRIYDDILLKTNQLLDQLKTTNNKN